MKKYWLVFKLSTQDIFQYRFDFVVHTTKYATAVLMMTLVWLAVQRESGNYLMSSHDTISYFVFAATLYSLSNFHTKYIEDDIKMGGLTKYLLKPIVPFTYYFTFESAVAAFETMLKATIMIPIIAFLGFFPTLDLVRLGMFCVFLPLIFTYAFHQFFLISSGAFWLREIQAIRWALMILFRFLAGTLVPLSFMPPAIAQILWWLPFPHLAHTPIRILQGSLSLRDGISGMLILLVWIAIIRFIGRRTWAAGTQSYDSAGI